MIELKYLIINYIICGELTTMLISSEHPDYHTWESSDGLIINVNDEDYDHDAVNFISDVSADYIESYSVPLNPIVFGTAPVKISIVQVEFAD